jgi:hypothetical protein
MDAARIAWDIGNENDRTSGPGCAAAFDSDALRRGIPTARGGKWFAASVRDVLARI